ncbi:putative N-alkane-inducible cytochrome P450 [Xylariaceae sp. FL1651]|nr:putative N-alkane-inducible cytochrome P450 [Xylariaceae sp. FL1651]
MNMYVRNALLLLVAFVTWIIVKSKLKKRRNNAKAASLGCVSPPVLRSKNLIGNSILRESMKATKEDRGPQYVVEKMDNISPNCHTIKLPVLDYELLITRDPENAKVLFTSPDFDISHTRQLSWMPLLGKGIFTSRGDGWKHSRALWRPQFAREMISNPSLEEHHLENLWERLPVDTSTGWTNKVDLAPLFFKFTLDTATEFIFGQSTYSLRQNRDDKEIDRHFNEAKVWIDKRGALAKFYWLLNSKEFKEHCNTIHEFVDSIVSDRLTRSTKTNADPEKATRFNLLNELSLETQDPRELRNETLHVLLAGRDTTGCLLGWVLYFLARYPNVYEKLRNTVLERFGKNQADFRSLTHVQYLQWIINEVLRVVTVIPMNERIALRDTTLPIGGGPDGKAKVFVPEGTQVLIPLYAMQHRKDLWGEDADEFRPERWETHKPGWEFIPFGAGARKCLGQQFGRQEVSYVISRFCQKYDRIENMEEGDGRIRLHHAIENRSGTGVQVRLHEAA